MELALYLTDVLRDILVAYLLMHFAGAGRLRGLVVPVLIIERVERFFELSHLLMHPLAPAVDVNLQDLYPTFASHCNQKIYAAPRFGIFFLFENKTPLN